jgi:hypothetical protein
MAAAMNNNHLCQPEGMRIEKQQIVHDTMRACKYFLGSEVEFLLGIIQRINC